MRKLLFLLAAVAVTALVMPAVSHAQNVKKITVVKDSTVNADNTIIPFAVDNTTKAVEVHATKVNGTVAGKMVVEGLAPDGVNWVGIDSVSLTDIPINFKVFPVTNLSFSSYRIKLTGTGSNKIKPIVAYTLRRS